MSMLTSRRVFGIIAIQALLGVAASDGVHLISGGKYVSTEPSGVFTFTMKSPKEFPDEYVVTISITAANETNGVETKDEAKAFAAFLSKLKEEGFDFSKLKHIYLPAVTESAVRQRVANAVRESAKWKSRTSANTAATLSDILVECDAFQELRKELLLYGLAVEGYTLERIYVQKEIPTTWVSFIRLETIKSALKGDRDGQNKNSNAKR